jgi:methylated-DNA-[protein]-cysteine S-methyltransferase
VRYAAEGWGVGELVFDGETLVHSEAPAPKAPVRGSGPAEGVSGEPGGSPAELAVRLRLYFAGERDDFLDVELDLDGLTSFQRAVCDALRAVPYGETVTYGELAALAGHPNAHRAAGTYCAHNRFSIVVPCHRVVAAGGVGSYGSLGVSYKRRLLELEGAVL